MTESKASQSFSAGELAARAGVSTDTLRHYERKGLIARPARQPNGYRRYATSTLDRVLLVRRALTIGFTLDELAGILKVRDDGGAPCRKVRDLAQQKLIGLDERLRELTTLRDELRATLKEWEARLAKGRPNQRLLLLENLQSSGANRPTNNPPFTTNSQRNQQRRNK